MLEEYKQLMQKLDELRSEITDKAEGFIREACQGLFAKYSELECFKWHQYTPYWNDGDPCYFRANVDYPYLTIEGETLNADELHYSERWAPQGMSEQEIARAKYLSQCADDVVSLLSSIDKDHYEWMFGDHVEVVVRRDGITVSDYSQHD
jgi:hypothetical protein